jgi:hypothetical protein
MSFPLSDKIQKYYANTGAATDGIVWSPSATARWYVTSIVVSISAAATITFEEDNSGGDIIRHAVDFGAAGVYTAHFDPPLFSTEDAADLLVTTTAGNVKVTVTGYELG